MLQNVKRDSDQIPNQPGEHITVLSETSNQLPLQTWLQSKGTRVTLSLNSSMIGTNLGTSFAIKTNDTSYICPSLFSVVLGPLLISSDNFYITFPSSLLVSFDFSHFFPDWELNLLIIEGDDYHESIQGWSSQYDVVSTRLIYYSEKNHNSPLKWLLSE